MNEITCPKCKGKGKVLTASRQTGYDQIEVPCSFCKGSGKTAPKKG